MKNKNGKRLTSYIKYLAVSGLPSILVPDKVLCNLTGNRPQPATFHTAKRWH